MLIYKMSSWLIKIGINYIQVLVFDNTNQQITFICILNNISPIAFRIERPHNLEIPEIVHMGPSLCYVSTFLDFIWPTHPYVSINSTERQQKNAIFLTPPTQSFWWRNVGMVPCKDLHINEVIKIVVLCGNANPIIIFSPRLEIDYYVQKIGGLRSQWN